MGARCLAAMVTAAEDPRTQSGSDAWEAFCITALDSYSNDLAPEVALSVVWLRQNQKNHKAQQVTSLASDRGAPALVILVKSEVPPVTRPLFANTMLDQI